MTLKRVENVSQEMELKDSTLNGTKNSSKASTVSKTKNGSKVPL